MKLPTEEQILEKWKSEHPKPLVSFLCTSYNQESYINNAIEGFLIQRTSYPFEIVIHDDKSTDNTQQIIKNYQSKYPKIIKTIFQKENQYSRGKSPLLIGLELCEGEYIAICEGDDYWINPEKTTKQLNIMLNDSSISMVVSSGKPKLNGKVLNEIIGYHGDNIKEISGQYILNTPESLAPTASYVVKKNYLKESLLTFKDAPVGDLFIELYNAVYGKLVYYPEVVCVYRRMAKNSWSFKMATNLENAIKHSESLHKTIEYSKELKGFEDLDWTETRARNLFNLAVLHLYQNDIKGFKKYITLSNTYRKLKGRKKLIFRMRNQGRLLYRALHTRKYLKSKLQTSIANLRE